jgi:Tol biopolymer transport system component/C-terminal processing protease CtpA/Prc
LYLGGKLHIKMKKIFFTHLTLLFCFSLIAQNSDLLLRHPALNTDGSKIAFSWQGDIWTASARGGEAKRLTIHEAYEGSPQWSPDGQSICFLGSRFGNNDVYVVGVSGGAPTRLTYHSANDGRANWGNDGQIYFTTRREFAEVEREQEIHEIKSTGGTPVRALDALGYNPVQSPDGRYIAFERGSCRVAREAYKGPANKEIWLYDTQTSKYLQVTRSDNQDIYPDWGTNGDLYFLSARSGRYNLYYINIKDGVATGEARRRTNFKDEGIRYYDVSADGKRLVFERGTGIYSMSAQGKSKPVEIKISVREDYRFDPIEKKTFSNNVRGYSVAPNGKYVALNVRGEIVVKQNNKDKKRTKVLTNDAARDQEPQWLSDTTLLFISDRKGNKDIYLMRSTDTSEINLYKTFKSETIAVTNTPVDEVGFKLSPDRKKIVIQKGRGVTVVADINENGALSNEKTLLDGWDTPGGLAWSPDGKWLAYSLDDLDFNSEIFIHAADNSQAPVNVSMHPRPDRNPVWSADGSKLGFISERNNDDADIWFAWLTKKDWEKTKQDWEEDEDEEDGKNGKKDKEKKDSVETETIQIDFENIHDRLEQVTSYPGDEGTLAISKDGETFYFSANGSGKGGNRTKRNFLSIKWDGTEAKVLQDDKSLRGIEWDSKQKNLYFLSMGKFNKLLLAGKKVEGQPFSAKLTIDHPGEKAQVFEDGWRALRDGFYDPNFHGQDWTALKNKYKKRAVAASTSQDFRVMFNEMLGQLNASHMGMYGSNPEKLQRDQTGLLGIEIKPVGRQGVQITRIVPDSPADREGSKLAVGEIITAVNGVSVDVYDNFYSLLSSTANERTLLNVKGSDGSTREVIIRPAASLNTQHYESWVKEQKRLTELYSGGQLGYIHIRGMNWPSFERFQRELMASGYGKKGIVIDVRYNGGGWTTDMLMAVLTVRQHAYTVPRGAAKSLEKEHKNFKEHYPYGERLPFPPLTLPSVALCNANSYSNAEIFSHAYKHLDLGTLVGVPTFGAVISTGGYGLIDGSYVRMPFRAWYVKATEENMEHGPAVPDVIVENAPDSKAKGKDEQLKKAVDILLQQIKE